MVMRQATRVLSFNFLNFINFFNFSENKQTNVSLQI